MKTLDFLHLDPKNTKNTVEGLQELLANLQLHYANLRGFHWNVKGLEFYGAHAKFEEFYDDTAAKVDEVAERILMLGGIPLHNYSEYLKISTIQESGVTGNVKEILKSILDDLKVLIGLERKLIATASESNDEVTVSLLSDFLSGQEKNVWMLTASLS